MHVVQILPELNQGGVERGTVELNRELIRRGIRGSVISRGGALVAEVTAEGGSHRCCEVCSKNPLTLPLRVRQVRRCLQQLQPDVIHVRSRVPAWLTLFANRSLQRPVVSTVHGFNSVNAYSAIMTRADVVVCGSSAIRDHVIRNYRVPESKLRVVLRGVDTDYFDPAAVAEEEVITQLRDWGWQGFSVVSSIGRITPLKGHDLFIRALAAVRKTNPRCVGMIVGGARQDKEGHLDELKALADSLGLRDALRFTGRQSDMRRVYAQSDLVVSATSLKPETFGRSAAEALAMNTPVVAARHGGPLDIVKEGQNGRFFEPGNVDDCAEAILATLSRKTFTEMRSYVQRSLSLDAMTESLTDIYRELTGG